MRGKVHLIAASVFAALAFIVSSTFSAAQDAKTTPQAFKPDNTDSHADTPTAPPRLRLSGTAPVAKTDPEPDPDEDKDTPPEPDEDAEEETPPTFFGEEIEEAFVFVLDRSGSMLAIDGTSCPVEDEDGNIITNPNRMQIVKAQAVTAMKKLDPEVHEFALVTFGGNVTYYQARVKATEANKQTAISQINSMQATGATPAYKALEVSTKYYGDDLKQFFFLSDGAPNVGGGPEDILTIFPSWYHDLKEHGCELFCIQIGESDGATEFMTSLAYQNGGKYMKQ